MALKCLTTKYRRRRQKEKLNREERLKRIAEQERARLAAYQAKLKTQEIQKLAHLLYEWLNKNPFYRFYKTKKPMNRELRDFRSVDAWWCPLCKLPITVEDLLDRNIVYQIFNRRRLQVHRVCPTDDTHGLPPGYVWLTEGVAVKYGK
jgi:replicative superfamily II helicase